MARSMWFAVLLVAACGEPRGSLGDAPGQPRDASLIDSVVDVAIDGLIDGPFDDALLDASGDAGLDAAGDAQLSDGSVADAGGQDASLIDAGMADAPSGIISGGPCSSGAAGATAYRIKWLNGSGSAYVQYEKHGLPDTTRYRAGAYGYQIGFTPAYVDPFLGEGGVRLDGSSFIDIELSTVGVSQISNATLSLYGRSYNTTASGSFNWQTFDGTGATATNFVSNVAPYSWYSANMTTEISPNDDGVLIRIKAGPSSGSLVVHRIEICMVAS